MSWSSDDGRIELVAHFTAHPGREEQVSGLLLGLAAKVRSEPGCLAFEPYLTTAPPVGSGATADAEPIGQRFVIVEAYRDAGAFAEHLAAGYGAEFNAALSSLIVEDGSQLTFLAPIG